MCNGNRKTFFIVGQISRHFILNFYHRKCQRLLNWDDLLHSFEPVLFASHFDWVGWRVLRKIYKKSSPSLLRVDMNLLNGQYKLTDTVCFKRKPKWGFLLSRTNDGCSENTWPRRHENIVIKESRKLCREIIQIHKVLLNIWLFIPWFLGKFHMGKHFHANFTFFLKVILRFYSWQHLFFD